MHGLIPKCVIENLVDSIPAQIQVVIVAEGGQLNTSLIVRNVAFNTHKIKL